MSFNVQDFTNSSNDNAATTFFKGRAENYATWVTAMTGPISALEHGVALMKEEIKLGEGDHPTVDLGPRIKALCRAQAMDSADVRSMVLKLMIKGNLTHETGQGTIESAMDIKSVATADAAVSQVTDPELQGGITLEEIKTPEALEAQQGSTSGHEATLETTLDHSPPFAPPKVATIKSTFLEDAIEKNDLVKQFVTWQTQAKERKVKEAVLKTNNKLYALIYKCISKQVRKYVKKIPLGHGIAVWKALAAKYEKKSVSQKRLLLRSFYNAIMKPGECAADFSVRILALGDKLSAMGRKLEDEDYLTALIFGLTPTYKALRIQLNNTTDAVGYEPVLSKIEEFEEIELGITRSRTSRNDRHQGSQGRRSDRKDRGKALYSNNGKFAKGKPKILEKDATCYACGKKGHFSKDCKSKSKLVCSYCNKKGHLEKMCFKKRDQGQANMALAIKGKTNKSTKAKPLRSSKDDQDPSMYWGLGLSAQGPLEPSPTAEPSELKRPTANEILASATITEDTVLPQDQTDLPPDEQIGGVLLTPTMIQQLMNTECPKDAIVGQALAARGTTGISTIDCKTAYYQVPLPPICFTCGIQGHIKEQCTRRKSTLHCNFCDSYGHATSVCFVQDSEADGPLNTGLAQSPASSSPARSSNPARRCNTCSMQAPSSIRRSPRERKQTDYGPYIAHGNYTMAQIKRARRSLPRLRRSLARYKKKVGDARSLPLPWGMRTADDHMRQNFIDFREMKIKEVIQKKENDIRLTEAQAENNQSHWMQEAKRQSDSHEGIPAWGDYHWDNLRTSSLSRDRRRSTRLMLEAKRRAQLKAKNRRNNQSALTATNNRRKGPKRRTQQHRGPETAYSNAHSWILDSGCTHSMSDRPPGKFRNWQPRTTGMVGIAHSGTSLRVIGEGTLGGVGGVWCVPELGHSLLSVRQLLNAGYKLDFRSNQVRILSRSEKNPICLAIAHMHHGLWRLPFNKTPKALLGLNGNDNLAFLANTVKPNCSLQLAHERLGHLNEGALKTLHRRGLLPGVKIHPRDEKKRIECDACVAAKAHRLPFPKETKKSQRPLHKVALDIFGKISPRAIGQQQYGLVLVDQFTRHGWIFFMRLRSEAPQIIIDWARKVERESGYDLRILQSDGEFTSGHLANWAERKGIKLQRSNARTPQQNALAERMVRTTKEMARVTLVSSGMAKRFWVEAVKTAMTTYNMLPHSQIKNNKGHNISPHEAYHETKPDYSRLRAFGCAVQVLIQKEDRRKGDGFGRRTKTGIYLGLSDDEGRKGYRIWDPKQRKIIESRDVYFNENECKNDTGLSSDSESTRAEPLIFTKDDDKHDDAQDATDSSISERSDQSDDSNGADKIPTRQEVDELKDQDEDGSNNTSDPCDDSISNTSNKDSYDEEEQHTDLKHNTKKQRKSKVSCAPAGGAVTGGDDNDFNSDEEDLEDAQSKNQDSKSDDNSVSSYGNQYDEQIDEKDLHGHEPVPESDVTKETAVEHPWEHTVQTRTRYGRTSKPPTTNYAPMIRGDAFTAKSLWALMVKQITSLKKIPTPLTFKEATQCAQQEQWRKSMEQELKMMIDLGVWEVVQKPQRASTVKNRWVYKIKEDEKGNQVRFKSRLVARGFTQKHGINYQETFSPVVRIDTLRLVLILATHLKMDISQMDIKSAYLQSPIDYPIYMTLPKGYREIMGYDLVENETTTAQKQTTKESITKGTKNKPGQVNQKPELVLKLKRAIYGLKQSGRCWSDALSDLLVRGCGLTKSNYDPCLYYAHDKNGKLKLIVLVYVDDLCIMASTPKEMRAIKSKIQGRFKSTDLGRLNWILGMQVTWNSNKTIIEFRLTKYINDVLERFGMSDCKTQSVPIRPGLHLTPQGEDKLTKKEGPSPPCDEQEAALYRSIIGSVMYLVVTNQPAIAHATYTLACFLKAPTKFHLKVAYGLLRHIKLIRERTLKIDCTKFEITSQTDSNWASCPTTRRSTAGYAFFTNIESGGAFSWRSKRMKAIALSSAEAEYMGAGMAAQEAAHMSHLIREIYPQHKKEITIFSDNQACILMSENETGTQRSKHVDIKYHYLKQLVRQRIVRLKHVAGTENSSDCLTKSLGKCLFDKHAAYLMGHHLDKKNGIPPKKNVGKPSPNNPRNNVAKSALDPGPQ